jgi:large subunit ribosomal protein L35
MGKKFKHKTRKAVAKRFRRSARGKILHAAAGRSHLLGGKSSKRKRNLRGGRIVSSADHHRVAGLLAR